MCTADIYKTPLSIHAEACGIVIFSVDYRLAPETKCPKNVLDFYCALRYIVDNAESLGVDPGRLAMGGESGGGYIYCCIAVMCCNSVIL